MNTIKIEDGIGLRDCVSNSDSGVFKKMQEYALASKASGPIGWVRLLLQKNAKAKKELMFEGHNMIVGQGRAFVAQRIFNFTDGVTDLRNYRVSHFGVGAGGATVNGDNITLLGPNVCDTALYKPITLNSTHNDPGNFDTSQVPESVRNLYTSVGAVKPIASLELMNEDYEDGELTCAYKTKLKCECIVDGGEPSALPDDGFVPISEAGLFITNGTDAKLFAHVCFAPKYKELDSIITIEWYVLC